MRYGLDLGGTKIEIAALAGDGKLAARRRVASPQGDYDATIAALRDLVLDTDKALGTTAPVGIGIPGTISPATGLVKNANSVWLIGHPLDKDLAAAIGRPVRVANDADCFVLSEASDGAAAGARSVFGVILGTGVGGGLVYEGRLIVGANSIAGEWGHNPLPDPRIEAGHDERPGPRCYCGRSGCIESFLSGPGFARDHELWTGAKLRAEQIVAAAQAGDAAARASVARYADRLARALATVVNLFDPEVIVFGGGMSNADFIYAEIPRLLPRYVFSDAVTTKIVRNLHGDSSGVRGAAWLWPA
ncbi:MAG: ROK family protein [Rhodospirillales bacterium]|nr:ROK family protein [Rhodospirillales bacterium]